MIGVAALTGPPAEQEINALQGAHRSLARYRELAARLVRQADMGLPHAHMVTPERSNESGPAAACTEGEPTLLIAAATTRLTPPPKTGRGPTGSGVGVTFAAGAGGPARPCCAVAERWAAIAVRTVAVRPESRLSAAGSVYGELVRVKEATFGFVDLAGFAALTEAHGDRRAVAVLDRFEAISRASLGPDDQLVKTIGDAVMLVFVDPSAAVGAIGRLFEACRTEPELPLPRSGLHHGEALSRDGDFFGASVNLAARVADQAHGGQVLATVGVASAARELHVGAMSGGFFELRNIVQPVELFELDVSGAAARLTIDPVCRMPVMRANAAGVLHHGDQDYWLCSLRCVAAFAAEPDLYVKALGTP
jgi:adenylate cyclase